MWHISHVCLTTYSWQISLLMLLMFLRVCTPFLLSVHAHVDWFFWFLRQWAMSDQHIWEVTRLENLNLFYHGLAVAWVWYHSLGCNSSIPRQYTWKYNNPSPFWTAVIWTLSVSRLGFFHIVKGKEELSWVFIFHVKYNPRIIHFNHYTTVYFWFCNLVINMLNIVMHIWSLIAFSSCGT